MNLSDAEASMTASNVLGMPFNQEALDCILQALVDARGGNGVIKPDGSDLLQGLKLDPLTRKTVSLRRLRMATAKAASETPYYGELFNRLGLDAAHLTWEDYPKIPLTSKETVRDHPFDFICRNAQVDFLTTTTGTTGRPTNIGFSSQENQVFMKLCAIFNIMIGDFLPEDIFLQSASSRAMLGNLTAIGCIQLCGTTYIHGGQINPEMTLQLLTQKYHLPGKKDHVTIFGLYPSYLGEVIECGLRLGYKPSDFGLRRFDVGGEIATQSLKKRAEQLFGLVSFFDSYGMTEIWGAGGDYCSQGHMHYGSSGIWEFINPETGQPAGYGEPAKLVVTVLPPYRETTLLLRFDTQDMVRMLPGPVECEAKDLPVSSPVMGKQALSVQHGQGWTFPREVMEALEGVDAVPLPARFGFWSTPGGVAVEVLVRSVSDEIRKAVAASLEAQNVPLDELILVESRDQLRKPFPLRCDLKEIAFSTVVPI
jgi:phenylacetate-coenzyme A ligase PaaK-like adenylate-forming protein